MGTFSKGLELVNKNIEEKMDFLAKKITLFGDLGWLAQFCNFVTVYRNWLELATRQYNNLKGQCRKIFNHNILLTSSTSNADYGVSLISNLLANSAGNF